jgi:uncharacterized protein
MMADAARVRVRLTPRAGRDELTGIRDGVLVARVTAPPVEDRANVALCRLLARAAGVPPSHVHVERGRRSREKLVRVEGLAEDELRRRLGSLHLHPRPPGQD